MEETRAETIMGHICTYICRWPEKAASQIVLDEICAGCKLPSMIPGAPQTACGQQEATDERRGTWDI